ncbi:related to 3`-_5` exoribonuclease [Cephalotrichum gorgonifer]|uniref:Related to 3`->5` exoribonuclease n=1 Tax=Cephalotrichum gorgonifer TaxID=2041049 RepID=A0AAE8MTD3_9PEZI|nr:related to 3`->5` exoribonuclease [Cephalotrichum gorgonifer]
MPITIIKPKAASRRHALSSYNSDAGSDSEGGVDLDGDVSMDAKSARETETNLVTPGEIITDDTQWMRGHGTYVPPNTTSITSSVAGTITKTNKLISVRPLRARYTPEIGDLVVGRITEVQSRRWRVDLSSSQLAILQLSAINLPGGIQRKRTETDELQIRSFFSEGDLVVAEVQTLHGDGAAALHTRSLRYGKLRNGIFLSITGVGGGGGVVRAKRQLWTMETGAGKVDVVLGVNGYIWICKHVESDVSADAAGMHRMDENVSLTMYSSQNDHIDVAMMREIARIRCVIVALVENGLQVDEDVIVRGYEIAVEMGHEDVEDSIYLGGERGQRLAAELRRK